MRIGNLITPLLLLFSTALPALEPPTQEMVVQHSVVKMRLSPSVTIEDATEAMLSKAVELNLALVARQKISDTLKRRGIDSPHLEIFQFCNPQDAAKMVRFDIIYASYMPCRIGLVEDSSGNPWLTTLNLNMMIEQGHLPEEIYRIAVTTNTKMLTIMTAGANGEF